jgi:hypothetical protein
MVGGEGRMRMKSGGSGGDRGGIGEERKKIAEKEARCGGEGEMHVKRKREWGEKRRKGQRCEVG